MHLLYIRCIEEIFRTQRTLCDLLRPSLEILSVRTSANTCVGDLKHDGHRMTKKNMIAKPSLSVNSVGHRLDALDTESAQLASRKLKLLTSMFHICD